MSKRKTIQVDTLKQLINKRIASPNSTPEVRKALAGVLDTVLHATNNYKGSIT